jgi:hypothetical protein
MVKVIGDLFETLGSSAQSAGNQVKTVVKGMQGDVKESLGLPTEASKDNSPDSNNPSAPNEEQLKKMKQASDKRIAANYQKIQKEILQLGQQRDKEEEKYHMPGNTDEEKKENQIKQLQEKENPEKKLPPLDVQKSQRKAEMHRGASG